jgi:CHRD domain
MSPTARRNGVSSNGVSGKRLTVIAVACAALAGSASQAFALVIPIEAHLTGSGEVPPNNSPAKGLMTGTFDTDTNTLTWSVTYSGITTPVIGAHFHGPVSYVGLTPEENAPIQVGTPGSLVSPFHGVAQISAQQAQDLKDGRYYFNLHSKKFPDGELRGPIVRGYAIFNGPAALRR